MRAQTEQLLESMRLAKEQEEQLRQQQLQFLQKQGEEYYRQMLLVGLVSAFYIVYLEQGRSQDWMEGEV